ncbi:NACHT domain-containing protein [Candidatus Bathyarchaeota archaeon]|nr:NACHT domain-containing protein [Candidatus Bathyarchaeota archaeon]
MAGAGKTVLMSHLIEETKEHCKQLLDEKITWVYYYCHYTHEQDEARPFLRWIISQLCRRSGSIPDGVYAMYNMGTQPSVNELLNALEGILRPFSRVHILLDAIDESETPRDELLGMLENLATDPRFWKIQIIASSRCGYVDIERTMKEVYNPILMKNALVEADIRTHVRSNLESDPAFKPWPRDLLAEVEETLPKKAEGMYVSLSSPRVITPYARAFAN